MQPGIAFLMYHELEAAGRALRDESAGYVRYVVRELDFREHLHRLKARGLRGVSVGEALAAQNSDSARVAITFDDGCESDWLVAAPLLQEFGFNATFYVVAGRLGEGGFLSREQARSLAESGFEVGSHSVTHAYLSALEPARLREEVFNSKDALERATGRRVNHLSCPGGRWSHAVAETCREAGYQSVATSRVGINWPDTDRFQLKRVVVQRGASANTVEAWSSGKGLLLPQARQAMLDAIKRLVGNTTYDRLRSAALREE